VRWSREPLGEGGQLVVRVVALCLAMSGALVACGSAESVETSTSPDSTSPGSSSGASWDSLVVDEETWDLVNEAASLIGEGDAVAAADIIRGNELLRPEFQAIFFSSAACHPDVVTYLVDELGFDPLVEVDGETMVYELTWPRFQDAPFECSEADRLASVKVFLELGVDPCRAPERDPDAVPAKMAESWGRSPEMLTLLQSYAGDCAP
jgi:hypothetical protein